MRLKSGNIKKYSRNTSRLNFKCKFENVLSSRSYLILVAIVVGNFKNFKKHLKNIEGWI